MRRRLTGSLSVLFCFHLFLTFSLTVRTDDVRHDLWTNFKDLYQKRYSEKEEVIRRSTFLRNVDFITRHNIDADAGLYTFWLAINQFADQTNEQYVKEKSSLSDDLGFKSNSTYTGFIWEVADHVDWRSKGVVTEIRNECSCRSSWAFATIAAIESQQAIISKSLTPLSEQQLIDCSSDFGNHGCHNGSFSRAFKYIEESGGIDGLHTYPYHGIEMICQFDRQHVVARISGFVAVENDDSVLKDAVANVGPIAVTLDVSPIYFQFYDKGIISNISCSDQEANHAMTVVGYGSDDGLEYWIVRNSWGTDWGEEGYLRLSRGLQNMCGITSNAAYPLLLTF